MSLRSVANGLFLTLNAAALPVAAQQPADTAVTVPGVLYRPEVEVEQESPLLIALPNPLTVFGRRVTQLEVTGDTRRWQRYLDRYVEVSGRVAAPGAGFAVPGRAVIRPERIREVLPEGSARRSVSLSSTQNAIVTLSVVPHRFAWRDSTGRAIGLVPAVVYSVANHGDVPLDFRLATNQYACVEVVSEAGTRVWQYAAVVPRQVERRLTINLGAVFRKVVPVTEEAAPWPGKYTVRASLCGIADYEVTTDFVVEAIWR